MSQFYTYLKYGCAILSFIGFIISSIMWYVNRKNHGKNVKLIDVYQKVMEIPNLVAEAEEIYPGSGLGSLKLQYVLNKLEISCVKSGIDYEAFEEDFKLQIEEVLSAPQKKE